MLTTAATRTRIMVFTGMRGTVSDTAPQQNIGSLDIKPNAFETDAHRREQVMGCVNALGLVIVHKKERERD